MVFCSEHGLATDGARLVETACRVGFWRVSESFLISRLVIGLSVSVAARFKGKNGSCKRMESLVLRLEAICRRNDWLGSHCPSSFSSGSASAWTGATESRKPIWKADKSACSLVAGQTHTRTRTRQCTSNRGRACLGCAAAMRRKTLRQPLHLRCTTHRSRPRHCRSPTCP